MRRADFDEQLVELRCGDPADGLYTMGVLMVALLKTSAPWAEKALLELMYGGHGDDLALLAQTCALNGCHGNMTGELGGAPQLSQPFAYWCTTMRRIELLGEIATRGLPAVAHLVEMTPNGVVSTAKSVSTTPAGRLLDRMSGVQRGLRAPRPTWRGTFAELLRAYRFAIVSADHVKCARLLARLDPGHRALTDFDDHPGIAEGLAEAKAFVTAEAMRERISTACADISTIAPAPARKARRTL